MAENDGQPVPGETGIEKVPEETTREAQLRAGFEIPNHRLLRKAGKGGMGTVYLAEDVHLGRKVAIKVNAMQGSGPEAEQHRQRFLREARTMASVDHPNLARIHSFGQLPGKQQYIIMEFVEGQDLRALSDARRMQEKVALDVIRQAALGLGAAWDVGIIHRDIKPENLLLDARGRVKVVDFGLAKGDAAASNHTVTQAGAIVGTPRYISPERLEGERGDHTCDIYALGLVLYRLLSGEDAVDAPTLQQTFLAQLSRPTPDITKKVPEISQAANDLIQWMTAKDPTKRPQTVEELVEGIDRVLNGGALPPSALSSTSIPQVDPSVVAPPSGSMTAPPPVPPPAATAVPKAAPAPPDVGNVSTTGWANTVVNSDDRNETPTSLPRLQPPHTSSEAPTVPSRPIARQAAPSKARTLVPIVLMLGLGLPVLAFLASQAGLIDLPFGKSEPAEERSADLTPVDGVGGELGTEGEVEIPDTQAGADEVDLVGNQPGSQPGIDKSTDSSAPAPAGEVVANPTPAATSVDLPGAEAIVQLASRAFETGNIPSFDMTLKASGRRFEALNLGDTLVPRVAVETRQPVAPIYFLVQPNGDLWLLEPWGISASAGQIRRAFDMPAQGELDVQQVAQVPQKGAVLFVIGATQSITIPISRGGIPQDRYVEYKAFQGAPQLFIERMREELLAKGGRFDLATIRIPR